MLVRISTFSYNYTHLSAIVYLPFAYTVDRRCIICLVFVLACINVTETGCCLIVMHFIARCIYLAWSGECILIAVNIILPRFQSGTTALPNTGGRPASEDGST